MSDALLKRLLWEVRVLRVLVLGLALGGGATLVAQNTPENDSPLLTRELTVARRDSKESIVLGAEWRPTLEMRDEGGRVRIRMTLGPNGPSLQVYDERGRSDDIFDLKPRLRPLTQ
jgi:hypothetical protein